MSNPAVIRRPPAAGEITSTIGAADRIRGEFHVGGCARVDGVVRGSIERGNDGSRLVIGPGGYVRGDIRVHDVWIEGQVVGRVEATGHVDIAATATVEADIEYGTLQIGAGAEVNGTLRCPATELRTDEE